MKQYRLNVGPIHRECALSNKNHWQTENKETPVRAGMYAKLKFSDDNFTEYMWVFVTRVTSGDIMYGYVDNDPVNLTNIHYKDKVKFRREDIYDLLK